MEQSPPRCTFHTMMRVSSEEEEEEDDINAELLRPARPGRSAENIARQEQVRERMLRDPVVMASVQTTIRDMRAAAAAAHKKEEEEKEGVGADDEEKKEEGIVVLPPPPSSFSSPRVVKRRRQQRKKRHDLRYKLRERCNVVNYNETIEYHDEAEEYDQDKCEGRMQLGGELHQFYIRCIKQVDEVGKQCLVAWYHDPEVNWLTYQLYKHQIVNKVRSNTKPPTWAIDWMDEWLPIEEVKRCDSNLLRQFNPSEPKSPQRFPMPPSPDAQTEMPTIMLDEEEEEDEESSSSSSSSSSEEVEEELGRHIFNNRTPPPRPTLSSTFPPCSTQLSPTFPRPIQPPPPPPTTLPPPPRTTRPLTPPPALLTPEQKQEQIRKRKASWHKPRLQTVLLRTVVVAGEQKRRGR
ncbi:unnamed protein product [Rotaria magnacalcarata]|uniref:Uncharacterized protein n=1 Tax=Rotaria magnacalcarata TaxID=392030 RepID=A0A815ULD0_9BILA|nr:unnamed protein product [Rotaria magnacalcarata]CAF4319148.1 unnamed protein product [Rotaria magnacalcarata]